MDIVCSCKNEVLIVNISGDIDHVSSSEIKRKISGAITRFKTNRVILNMENVEFMDSSGIGMLIGRYKEMTLINGEVVLAGVSECADKILKLSGLYKLIKKFKNTDKALAYFERGVCNE